MPRHSLLLLLLAPAGLRGDEAEKKIVAAAGPSIVRVHVSRSSGYAKARYWGARPKREWPGQLGRFDAGAAIKSVPADAPGRERILRAIRAHDLGNPKLIPESYGSGLVVDRSGLVLTNAHVVRDATKVYVRLPGKRGSYADVYAADPRSDFAILKLLDPPRGLKALKIGDGGKLARGDRVLCLVNELAPGFPADDAPDFSSGEVSKLRHRLLAKEKDSEAERARYPLHYLGNLIQTTGAVAPACSGGALLNADGEAVALTCVVSAVRGRGRGGFAIPLDTNAKRVIAVLKKGGEVEYGFLGVMLDRDDRPGRGGVNVLRISPGSPASRPGGLQRGDRVVRIDGKAVRHNDDLFLSIGMALAGNTVRVVVDRRGRQVTTDVTLAKFYVPGKVIAARRPPAKFGLRVDWTSVLLVRNPFPFTMRAPASGVVIREVVEGSPADKARLQPDKIITEVNGQAVGTPAEYYREVAKAGKKVELTYLTSRGSPDTLTLEEK